MRSGDGRPRGAYDRVKPFTPTLEDPGPVAFSEDGQTWSITRDVFLISPEGELRMQMFVTELGRPGDVLEPAVQHVDRGLDDRPGE
jgi:hypothetical protein